MKRPRLIEITGKTIPVLGFVLAACLVIVFTLGLKVIREKNHQLIGKADTGLSHFQLLTYDLIFFLNQNELLEKNNNPNGNLVDIPAGILLDTVLLDLEEEGIVNDSQLLRKILIYSGADRRILPGKYQIPAGSSLVAIAKTLQDPDASLIEFAILPGWRKEEIAASLPTSGLQISSEEFLQAVEQPVSDQGLLLLGIESYEGVFAPGMYTFQRSVSLDKLINSLTGRFIAALDVELREGYAEQGLSISEAVILASIIQKEAVIDEEKPLMASVFLNRLREGIPLQSDPTVQYALGYNPAWGWWKSPLNYEDLQVESVYNTYVNVKLPPAPISNPDMSSLLAVASPEETNYYYFRALCDGSYRHVFSETLEEHISNACLK